VSENPTKPGIGGVGESLPKGARSTRSHKDVDTEQDEHKRREFMHAMLADLRALDRMLREQRFETGPRRILRIRDSWREKACNDS
jgi:hypothetical protein